jgi:glyoxylase-like metal-dependent hydrolase (beta-lactamase superfamily II)
MEFLSSGPKENEMDVHIVEVAEGIYEMRPQPALEVFCASYLIEATLPALIETGPGYQAQAILKELNRFGQIPSYVILTHNHFDHCGGVGQVIANMSEATIVTHEDTISHLVDPTRLIKGIKRVFGDDFEQVYGAVLPVPEERILAVKDGSVISLGDQELQVVHAPGHVGHQIAVYHPLSQGLFVGDAIGGPFRGAEYCPNVAPPDFDLELQLETIEKLKRLSPR